MRGLSLLAALAACNGKEPCGPDWEGYELGASALYVDASAEPGGDGRRCHPFTRIGDALDVSEDGGTIAIVGGTYVENLAIEGVADALRIVGHDRDEVIIDGSEGDEDESTVLVSDSDEVGFEGLTITGAPYVGLTMVGSGVGLSDVTVTGNYWKGVAVSEVSDVTMEDVEISANLPLEEGAGYGLTIKGASVVSGREVSILDNTGEGVVMGEPGTELSLSSSEISGTTTVEETGEYGIGVLIFDGASLTLNEGTSLADNGYAAISLAWAAIEGEPEPPSVTLDDVSILSTRSVDVEGEPVAMGVLNLGGTLTVQNTTTISETVQAVWIEGTYGATATISALTVHGSDEAQTALTFLYGADASVQQTAISGPFSMALWAAERGTTVTASELSITACARAGQQPCIGAMISSRAELILEGGEISGTVGAGLSVTDGASVDATNLSITDTTPALNSDGDPSAIAINVDDADLTLLASSLERNAIIAVAATNGASVTIGSELVDGERVPSSIIGTSNTSGSSAVALFAVSDGGDDTRIEMTDGTIEATAGWGVIAWGAGARIELDGTDIRATTPGTSDPDEATAAVVATVGGRVTLTDLTIADTAGSAIYVDGTDATDDDPSYVDAGEVDITTVTAIGDNPAIGAYTEEGGYFVGTDCNFSVIEGPALYGVDGLMGCTNCEIADVEFAAIVAQAGSVVALSGATIDATGADYGVWTSSDIAGNALVIEGDSAITGASIAAVAVKGRGYYVIQDSELGVASGVDSRGATLNGNAIFASGISTPWDEDTGADDSGAGLYISGNDLHDNTGPAVLLLDATATIGCNDWSDNRVDLAWQEAESAPEPAFVDCSSDELSTDLDPSPSYGYIDPDSVEFVFDQQLTIPTRE